jgi:hypothetical protein
MQVFDTPLRWPHHSSTTSTSSDNGGKAPVDKRATSTYSTFLNPDKRAMSYDRRMSSSHSIFASNNAMTLMSSSSLLATTKELTVIAYCCGHAFHQTCLLPSPPPPPLPSMNNHVNNTINSSNAGGGGGGGGLCISRQNSLVTTSLSMQGRLLLSPPLSPNSSQHQSLTNLPRSPYPVSDQQSEEAQEIQLFSASSRPSESLAIPCPVCHPPRLLSQQMV